MRSEGITRIDAMKLDVEGAEDLILDRSCATTPGAAPALLVIEDRHDLWQTD